MSQQDKNSHLSNKDNTLFFFVPGAHSIAMISVKTQAHLDQAEKSISTDSRRVIYDAGNSFGRRDETYSKNNKQSE